MVEKEDKEMKFKIMARIDTNRVLIRSSCHHAPQILSGREPARRENRTEQNRHNYFLFEKNECIIKFKIGENNTLFNYAHVEQQNKM